MNNNNTSSIPGMIYPTQRAMLSGTPQDSAIASMNAANNKLAALQSVGGKRKRKYFKKGGKIVVPQFNMLYNSAGGPGQTPNDIIKQNASISTQGAENAVFDKYAVLKGGNIHINNNTNKFEWGCYSGGKKYKNTRKSKKSRKSRTNKKYKTSRKNTRKYLK